MALDARTVVVVDEAAIVGTRKLARLLDHAEAARAKIVLVGDHYQLPEIDAGSPPALAHRASRRPPQPMAPDLGPYLGL